MSESSSNACNLHQGLLSEEIPLRFGSISLMIRLICWGIACFSSSQHAGAAKKNRTIQTSHNAEAVWLLWWKEQFSSLTELRSCQCHWRQAESIVNPLCTTAAFILRGLDKDFSNHMTSVSANCPLDDGG